MADVDEASARAWVAQVSGMEFDASKSFLENLKSGVILCELINKISPGAVKKVNRGNFAMQQMNNISMFLKGCQDLGLPSGSCFDPMRDVHEAKDSSKVLNCLSSLGGICQSKSISVPAFGKSNFAKANKREWTTEQLKEQKEQDRGTMLNNGSASTMERQAISKGGITFGSTFGAGSGEGTMLNNGSSGTMERAPVSKGGITFGNDHAGAGSGEATMLNTGSAGTMERQAVSKGGITFGATFGAGSGEGTMLNNGSAGTMERQAVSKGGITFGSTFGAGSGEGTMLNNGSSGTMERQAVSKGGITFGNDHAGAGSGEATMFDKAIAAGTASPKDAAPPEPPSPKDASPPEPPEPPTDEEDA